MDRVGDEPTTSALFNDSSFPYPKRQQLAKYDTDVLYWIENKEGKMIRK